MIDEKKIEEAASTYGINNDCSVIGRDGRMSLKPELENAFEAGAKWAIKQFLKDLWHPTRGEPEEGRNILIEQKHNIYPNPYYYTAEEYNSYYDDPWNVRVMMLNITRWLYIDDLLPKKENKE